MNAGVPSTKTLSYELRYTMWLDRKLGSHRKKKGEIISKFEFVYGWRGSNGILVFRYGRIQIESFDVSSYLEIEVGSIPNSHRSMDP